MMLMLPPPLLVPSKETLEWLTLAGGIGAALWRWGYRPMRDKVRSFRESWATIADAVAVVPDLVLAVKSITAELRPNGGSSMRDGIDRIERRTLRLTSVAVIESAARRMLANAPESAAMFEIDKSGEVEWASAQWLHWTRQNTTDAQGWGWVNALHQTDRERVIEEWNASVEQQRAIVLSFRLCKYQCEITDGPCLPAARVLHGCLQLHCTATPVFDEDNHLLGYVAVLTPRVEQDSQFPFSKESAV